MSTGGYDELVLYRLNELAKAQDRLEEKVDVLLIDVAMLKVKAGAWGAIAGMVPASLAVAVSIFLA